MGSEREREGRAPAIPFPFCCLATSLCRQRIWRALAHVAPSPSYLAAHHTYGLGCGCRGPRAAGRDDAQDASDQQEVPRPTGSTGTGHTSRLSAERGERGVRRDKEQGGRERDVEVGRSPGRSAQMGRQRRLLGFVSLDAELCFFGFVVTA